MNRRGFTLIELLVVIAIIGILSSIIIVGLNSSRQSARDAKRVADLKNIQLALSLYYQDYGRYPCQIYTNPSNPACPAFLGVYITSVPTDPLGSSAPNSGNYTYAALIQGTIPGIGACNVSSGPAPLYHLGAALERVGSSLLSQDEDLVTNGSGQYSYNGTNYVACAQSLSNFHGNAKNTLGCEPGTYSAGTSPELCYDVGIP